MNREEPYYTKCCHVVPLRICLQTWAVIKMVIDLLSIVGSMVALTYFVSIFIWTTASSETIAIGPLLLIILFVLLAIALCVDFGFSVTLSVGVAKNNLKLLQTFCIYDIYLIIMETGLFIAFIITMSFLVEGSFWVFLLLLGLPYIVLDVFVFTVLKSEIIKIRNKKQYSFDKLKNHPSEFEDVKFKAEDI